jgi:integrase
MQPQATQENPLPDAASAVMLPPATGLRRKRGPSLSRRTGQKGNVFQKESQATWNPSAPAYGRFWIDVPGKERQRKKIALGVCRTASIAKQKLREHIEFSGVNSTQTFVASTSPATTFRAQASVWIDSLSARRRRPVKPATIQSWQSCLDKWLVPNLGDMPLSDVANGALKALVEKMAASGLQPKSIVNYCAVVKLVVASAVNAEGEQIYPRKWNHEFIGLPIVDKNKQHRPTLTAAEVTAIVAAASDRYKILFALLAGTGLRIGEALALKTTSLASDCHVINVQSSIWHGREQHPKTPNAIRVVDVPEALAKLLREHAVGKDGYLFATSSSRPLGQRNVLRTLHLLAGKIGLKNARAKGKSSRPPQATQTQAQVKSGGLAIGLHAFRRFRTAVVRKARVPEDLIGLWLGHAGLTVTDSYARQLRDDVAFRQECAEACGLGFELGHVGPQKVVEMNRDQVA